MLHRTFLLYILIANWNTHRFHQFVLPDEPPPNITDILASKITLNKSDDNTNLSMDYFQDTEDPENSTGYLDFSVLDPATVTGLYKIAQEKNIMAERELNRTVGRKQANKHQAYHPDEYFVTKALDLMKQSIYATRFRLQDTRPLRKKFSGDMSYDAAVLYGSLVQIRMKMENIYATMQKFTPKVRFIWYLVLYERCLTAHVDVTYGIQKLFDIYAKLYKIAYGD